jgi:TolA-binding protein
MEQEGKQAETEQERKQDLLSKLADRGEQMIGRITDLPGAKSLLDSMQTLRERMDDMQKRVRGLESLETRMSDLERRIETLEGGASSRRAPATRTTSTKASGGTAAATPRKAPPKSSS